MNIEKDAPVISRQEILISAAVEAVWNLFTDVSNWAKWNKEIVSSKFDEPLAVGSTFHWETAGMKIASTIGELSPNAKIAWSGEVQGITGIHVWKFTSDRGETIVQTEESWSGEPVKAQIDATQKALDESLRSWLESLKRQAEGR